MKQDDIEIKVIQDPALHQEGAAGSAPDVAPASADNGAGTAAKEAVQASANAASAAGEGQEEQTSTMVRTLEDIVEQEAREESVESPSNFSLSRTLGGAIVARFIHKQMGLMLLIVAFLIIYITCRFMCQKQLVEIDRLEQKLVMMHYKAIVFSSQLTEKSRESNIMNLLDQKGDTTLKVPKDPPYKINIPEE